jgi:PKD repeat protein
VISNFGEGEGTSSERNISHIYTIPGTYYATQAVTNSENPAGVNTKTVIITSGESNVSLVSNFNGNSTS